MLSRRKLLAWTPPVVASVALPAHAQMSICGSTPFLEVAVPAKCSGMPPVGNTVLTLLSNENDPLNPFIDIISITVRGDSTRDTITLPSLPANISGSIGLDIEWEGDSTDATTCLPISSIELDVEYQCGDSMPATVSFNLTTVLSTAL